MEEWVGKLWHRWITKAAGGHYPEAAVSLKTMERPLAIFFRALGGDAGLRVAAATADAYGHRPRRLGKKAHPPPPAPPPAAAGWRGWRAAASA